MPLTRRRLLAALGAAPAAALLPRAAFAAYPDRPIHLVVPFAPGGNADVVGRIVAEQIGKGVGQPVVVDNRGGAGGSIGAEAVARADPRRLHAAGRLERAAHRQPVHPGQARLRPAQGFRRRRAHQLRAARHRAQPRRRGQDRARIDRAVERAARQHRHQRRRQRHPHDARALQGGDRRQAHAYSLQERRPAAARSARAAPSRRR